MNSFLEAHKRHNTGLVEECSEYIYDIIDSCNELESDGLSMERLREAALSFRGDTAELESVIGSYFAESGMVLPQYIPYMSYIRYLEMTFMRLKHKVGIQIVQRCHETDRA